MPTSRKPPAQGATSKNPSKSEAQRVPVAGRAALRAWFSKNHALPSGVWLVYERSDLTESDAIDEALCFGWIDSQSKKLDDKRSMLYVSPRKPRGTWSARNKARVEALETAGRMTPAGRAKIDAAKADGSWEKLGGLDAAQSLTLPPALANALSAKARAHFDAFPPGARRAILAWIHAAKRDETRAKRVADTAKLAAKNQRAGPAA